MFTGIVEEVGRVIGFEECEAGARLRIACAEVQRDAAPGASVAVNGACLTAVELSVRGFAADLAPETLQRTNLGELAAGSLVNLERPLRADSRLDGHFVLGHVDGTAIVTELTALGSDNWWLQVRLPAELSRYVVHKGSVAIDGMSLTVAKVEQDAVSFTVIPYTYENTALRDRRIGARLNVEVDILAKHLERLIEARSG